jgi:hypothetical protein
VSEKGDAEDSEELTAAAAAAHVVIQETRAQLTKGRVTGYEWTVTSTYV